MIPAQTTASLLAGVGYFTIQPPLTDYKDPQPLLLLHPPTLKPTVKLIQTHNPVINLYNSPPHTQITLRYKPHNPSSHPYLRPNQVQLPNRPAATRSILLLHLPPTPSDRREQWGRLYDRREIQSQGVEDSPGLY